PRFWDACETYLGHRVPSGPAEERWLLSHAGGDPVRTTHLFKDAYYWRRYSLLRETFQPVDYDTLVECDDETVPTAEVACAGGACAIQGGCDDEGRGAGALGGPEGRTSHRGAARRGEECRAGGMRPVHEPQLRGRIPGGVPG